MFGSASAIETEIWYEVWKLRQLYHKRHLEGSPKLSWERYQETVQDVPEMHGRRSFDRSSDGCHLLEDDALQLSVIPWKVEDILERWKSELVAVGHQRRKQLQDMEDVEKLERSSAPWDMVHDRKRRLERAFSFLLRRRLF